MEGCSSTRRRHRYQSRHFHGKRKYLIKMEECQHIGHENKKLENVELNAVPSVAMVFSPYFSNNCPHQTSTIDPDMVAMRVGLKKTCRRSADISLFGVDAKPDFLKAFSLGFWGVRILTNPKRNSPPFQCHLYGRVIPFEY
jgi:hypothetical protein